MTLLWTLAVIAGIFVVVVVFLLYMGLRYLQQIYSFFSSDVMQWRQFDEINNANTGPRWFVEMLLETLVEEGDVLFKPHDAAVSVCSRFIDRYLEPLPEEKQSVQPELVDILSAPDAFHGLPKDMYVYRLDPKRPRRGPKRSVFKSFKGIVLGPVADPQTA